MDKEIYVRESAERYFEKEGEDAEMKPFFSLQGRWVASFFAVIALFSMTLGLALGSYSSEGPGDLAEAVEVVAEAIDRERQEGAVEY